MALAVGDFGNRLVDSGRLEEALTTSTEIVQTYRRLAAQNPAAYDSELAHALRNFARQRVAEQIALPEALIAAYESVAIYSRLGQRLPEAFTGEVRRALAILADVQAALTTQQKTTAVDPRTPKVSLLRRWIRRSREQNRADEAHPGGLDALRVRRPKTPEAPARGQLTRQ